MEKLGLLAKLLSLLICEAFIVGVSVFLVSRMMLDSAEKIIKSNNKRMAKANAIFELALVLVFAILMSIVIVVEMKNSFVEVNSAKTNSISENSISMNEIAVGKDGRASYVVNGDLEKTVSENSITNKAIVLRDIGKIKAGDKEEVLRWFGQSDVYTSEFISNSARQAATLVAEENDGIVNLVIEYTSYKDISNEINELKKQGSSNSDLSAAVKEMLKTNKYLKHESVYVTVKDGKVVVTEKLKRIVTCESYAGYVE